MRLLNIIVLSVVLCVFSVFVKDACVSLNKLNCRIEELRVQNDSLSFISESFYCTCEGKGFTSLDEWKTVCSALWNLESINWNDVSSDKKMIYGMWSGSGGDYYALYIEDE